jgi:hypothetical protein
MAKTFQVEDGLGRSRLFLRPAALTSPAWIPDSGEGLDEPIGLVDCAPSHDPGDQAGVLALGVALFTSLQSSSHTLWPA